MRNHLYEDWAPINFWVLITLNGDGIWEPAHVQSERFTEAEFKFYIRNKNYGWVCGRDAAECAHYIKRRNMKRAAWRKGAGA